MKASPEISLGSIFDTEKDLIKGLQVIIGKIKLYRRHVFKVSSNSRSLGDFFLKSLAIIRRSNEVLPVFFAKNNLAAAKKFTKSKVTGQYLRS